MIVVGGGSSTRFGSDKLLTPVLGRPLIAHTVDAVVGHVDRCVVVVRPEIVDEIASLDLSIEITPGGATRTLSEMAGLTALGESVDVIGIHDAARPAPSDSLIEDLFDTAESVGGAVPIVPPEVMIIDRKTHRPVSGLSRAQTPQVFRATDLIVAYVKAAQSGFEGHDTAEVVAEFTNLTIATVPGEPSNLKVTYPEDLVAIEAILRDRSRT
jgi:2-C-methyl-D-erythritol 4-phosphate cytidylyltransferase